MAIRYGSWSILGQRLPEFGITEAIGGLLGSPRTTQGGSNILGAQTTQPPISPTWSGPSSNWAGTGGHASQIPPYTPPVSSYAPPVSSGGGGGSLGGTQTQDWDRMWREAGNTGIRPEGYHGPADTSGEDLARQQAQLELEQALTEYDRYTSEAEAQKGALGTQRTQTLSELETGYGRAEKQALASKEESTSATLSAKNKALITAQDVQRKNRNILRALGILSSSKAGEMLNRPMEEYGTQAGTLETNLIKRKDQVNDWLAERLQDFNTAKINLNDQFTQLMDNINRDLRFNDRQRITAVKAAQVAAQNAVQTLKQQAMAYQQAAQQYNANILTQIAQIKLTQNPQADVSGILSAMINPSQQSNYKSPTTSIYQTEEQRRRLSGLGV